MPRLQRFHRADQISASHTRMYVCMYAYETRVSIDRHVTVILDEPTTVPVAG